MPSPTAHRRKRGLWLRMALACLILLTVTSVLLAAELLLFSVLAYGTLLVLTSSIGLVVTDPRIALVLAVVAFGTLLVLVLSAYRAAQSAPPASHAATHLLTYVSAMLVLASIVVTYWLMDLLGAPGWVFPTITVVAFAAAYFVSMLQAAQSSDDFEQSDLAEVSVLRDVEVAAAEAEQLLRRAVDRLGFVGTPLTILLVGIALGVVFLAADLYSASRLLVPVAAIGALLIGGYHLGDLVRTERHDTAVLRELDGEFEFVEATDDRDVVEDRELTADTGAAADEEDMIGREAPAARLARLAHQADVPAPELQLVKSFTPTAAAVGYRPSTSTIVVSTGLVESLDDDELDAVLAHELVHVANHDAAVLTALSFPRASAHTAVNRYGMNPVMAVLAGVVAATSRLSSAVVTRAREYAADDGAVALTGDPAALASALDTLDAQTGYKPSRDLRQSSMTAFSIVPAPWEEHRFFDRTRRFVSRGPLGTHPPTADRVERLQSWEGNQEES